ncbi:MAG: dolichyl-phosphate beta-glucosyltransferase [Armatimonadota bacterium]
MDVRQVSIIVPAYNEERRIEQTVRAVMDYMAGRYGYYEIIVSDDGSQDRTGAIVDRLEHEALPVRLVRAERNRGKGSAVRLGVAASTGDLVLITDVDLATPIEEMERLRTPIESGADIAIGSRGMRDSELVVRQPFHREFMGRFFNTLVQLMLLPGVCDTQCGFKLFRGTVARRLFAHTMIDGFAFDVEVLGLAARAGYHITEVPVRWFHMQPSKVRLGRDGPRMFRDLIRVATHLRIGRYDLAALEPMPGDARPAAVAEKT